MMKHPEIWVSLEAAGDDFQPDMVRRFLELGVNNFEAGVTLIHQKGMGVVRELRKLVGSERGLGVDVKTQDGCYYHLKRAIEYGGDYGTVCVANNKAAFFTSQKAREELNIKAVADLYSVAKDDFASVSAKAREYGFWEIRINGGYDAWSMSGGRAEECEGYDVVRRSAGDVCVSVACYGEAGAEKALALGVSKIVLCDPLIRGGRGEATIQKLLASMPTGRGIA